MILASKTFIVRRPTIAADRSISAAHSPRIDRMARTAAAASDSSFTRPRAHRPVKTGSPRSS